VYLSMDRSVSSCSVCAAEKEQVVVCVATFVDTKRSFEALANSM
jgi:hypothetical protein